MGLEKPQNHKTTSRFTQLRQCLPNGQASAADAAELQPASTMRTVHPMRPIKLLLLPVLLILLNGCIYLDRSEEYRRAGSIKTIEVPEEFGPVTIEPLYPIPAVVARTDTFYDIETDGFVIPRPEPMSTERQAARVKMQKVGNRRWILLEAPAGQVWPLAQSFLSEVGITVNRSQPAVGLIETDWVQFQADPSTRHRYRLRIEQGVRPDTTEIHVLQRHAPMDTAVEEVWPDKSTDPERESWLLEELANSLALSIENRAASLLGQSVGGEVKAALFIDDGEPALQLRLSPVRAWASLAHALNQEGFQLWEDQLEQRVMHFQYIDPQTEDGRLKRWLGMGRKTVREQPQPLDQVLANLADTPETRALFQSVPAAGYSQASDNSAGFLLVLEPRGEVMVAKLRDARGQRLATALNKQLLSTLRRNLI